MNDETIEKVIAELRECWPYQDLPDLHLRHWRDTLRSFSRDIVRRVLMDCKSKMKGRPTWGEFGHLCHELSVIEANKARHGPYLEEVSPDPTPADEFTAEIAKLKALTVRP